MTSRECHDLRTHTPPLTHRIHNPSSNRMVKEQAWRLLPDDIIL